MAEDHVIEVQGLVKRFGAVTAVDDVSFGVRRGEVFGILGPNGAGKTTTLECIEGVQKPTVGSIRVLGWDMPREGGRVKERIGVQLQASAYFDYLTLREILDLFGRFYSRRVAPEALLHRVGLVEKANTTIGKLSGGQKQRFAIAATLVNDPELVFLDEPTTGLDPKARRDLWGFIRAMHGDGHTVVLTTHYMEEAQALCQRVAIMDRGKIVALDAPDTLARALPAPFEVAASFEGALAPQALATLEGLEAVLGVRATENGAVALKSRDAARTLPVLLRWAEDAGVRLKQLEVKPANLEDVFLALTGRGLGQEGDGADG